MENKTVFNPSLKKVLKSYQAAATTSLNGPNCYQDIWKGASGVEREKSGTNSELVGSVRRKPIPPPIIIPADRPRCERSETVLEGETISCFIVGGEKRLCLPQILNTVLKDFSLQQINSVCDELQIFCSRCTTEQLEVLKLSGILPPSAPSCGLITKTDAERLCADLLYSTSAPKEKDSLSKDFSFRVYHECFGKCTGTYYPTLYTSASSKCIECTECSGLFAPQKFVCHSHKSKENRTCHWGFDSNNWRAYLLLAKDHKLNMDELQGQLNDMKGRFDYSIHRCSKKRKLTPKKEDGREQPPLVRTTPIYPYLFPPPVWSMDPSLMMYWYRGHLAAKYADPSAMQKHEKIDPLLVNIHALLVKHNVDKDLRSQIYNEIENIVKQVRSEHGTT